MHGDMQTVVVEVVPAQVKVPVRDDEDPELRYRGVAGVTQLLRKVNAFRLGRCALGAGLKFSHDPPWAVSGSRPLARLQCEVPPEDD